jgi:hypothetical protein
LITAGTGKIPESLAINGSEPSVTWAGATDEAVSAASTVMADRMGFSMYR